MALRTHFNQSEIGCPGVAEFTVQRTEALFDHITGLRQISVTFGLRFRQRTVAVGFAHNAVLQPMLFQMLPVFLTVIAFIGIDGRIFGYPFQQRQQVVALMGIGLDGLLEESAHEKSPKCLGGNLGDFGEFWKILQRSQINENQI